jgi:hypothetical protein
MFYLFIGLLVLFQVNNVLSQGNIVLHDSNTNSTATISFQQDDDLNFSLSSVIDRINVLELQNMNLTNQVKELLEKNDDLESRIEFLEGSQDRTIQFNNSMTVEQIQAVIDSIPKYVPYGKTVNINFAKDGVQETYVFTDTLYLRGFYGGGEIMLNGDPLYVDSDTSHITQRAILDGATNNVKCIRIENTALRVAIYNLKFISSSTYAIEAVYSDRIRVYCSYFYQQSYTTSHIRSNVASNMFVYKTYFEKGKNAVQTSYNGMIDCNDCYASNNDPPERSCYGYGGICLFHGPTIPDTTAATRGGLISINSHNSFNGGVQQDNDT